MKKTQFEGMEMFVIQSDDLLKNIVGGLAEAEATTDSKKKDVDSQSMDSASNDHFDPPKSSIS